MERVLSTDERIRRAEEIYQRRRQNYRTNQARVNVSEAPKEYKLFKKMIVQIMVCLVIYSVFYIVKNNNYIFSEEFIKQSKEVLSYDINIPQMYDGAKKWISSLWAEPKADNISNTNEEVKNEETKDDVQTVETSAEVTDNATDQKEIPSIETEQNTSEEKTLSVSEDASSISETLTDAEFIKKNYSIIKPLSGTITSRFGVRNPTTPTVPTYHTGIDIAANTGTQFIAAMSGTVIQVSSEGDYGNHVKILQDDVATLYAHCSKIYVNEGESIEQGQPLGEVGQTGNATGPHLHFEIRKEERYVNPDDVLDF